MAITDKQLAALKSKDSIIIIPNAPEAADHAKMFLDVNAPSVVEEMRVFEELWISTLQQNINIICVFRSIKKPSKEYKRVDGDITYTPRPDRELMDEVIVTAPIRATFVREHPMKPPVLDRPAFFELMGKETVQYGFHFEYIDKGMQNPQILRLGLA
jgi:hypothetical protein